MGGHSVSARFDGRLTRPQLEREYDKMVEELRVEYGTDPYNGTFSTCSGLTILDEVFDTGREAEDWILERATKWEDALAVRVRNVEKKTKGFTYGVFGNRDAADAVLEGYNREVGSFELHPADELTSAEARKGIKLFTAYFKNTERDEAIRGLNDLERALNSIHTPLPKGFMRDVNAARRRLLKAETKHQANKVAWEAFNTAMREKYHTTTTEKGDAYWLVAGWAAS